MLNKYIISLEFFHQNTFVYHVVSVVGRESFTIHTSIVYSSQDSAMLEKNILYGNGSDLGNVVKYFKEKYKLNHRDISLSFGPLLRKQIKKLK